MPDSTLLSVNEAAERLGISRAAIRQQITAGRLPAVKRGRSWWLDERAVERNARQGALPGRPLSPRMAWAIILLASGEAERAKRLVERERYASRMRAWLKAHPLDTYAPQLRLRAESEELDGHPSELKRLLARGDVLATGDSAGEVVGLLGKSPGVEVYAPTRHRAAIVREHALTPSPGGPIRIRWVDDELWQRLQQDGERQPPRTAILLDLLESENPRARREAERALQQ
jgi:excisionase family DNA binding protein